MKTARAAAVLALLAGYNLCGTGKRRVVGFEGVPVLPHGFFYADNPVTISGLISAEVQNLDLLRLLMERPLLGGHNRFDRRPGIEERVDQLWKKYEDSRYDGDISPTSPKRSAVATALNAGRPRRQPAPALGKAVTVTPFAGIGILNDMETFFESLRGNLEGMASLSPDERATFYEPPTVVRAPPSGGGGGSGMRKLHALRPLRPTGNIRSYNRRSLVEDHIYPGANRHDPGLLWAGLGR